jgi:hypothetical protein
MKNKCIYLGVLLFLFSCGQKKNATTDLQSLVQPLQADSATLPIDSGDLRWMSEVKQWHQFFSGKHQIYNTDGKLLREVAIDDEGVISGSNIYKKLRIWHSDEINRLILMKGIEENHADRDTFELERKSGKAFLYLSVPAQNNKRVKGLMRYIFEKVS